MSQRKADGVVGVIVARLQVPELHEGHRHTIKSVMRRHKTVLFILGDAYTSTEKDPLSFEMRVMMIKSAFPGHDFIFVASRSLTSSSLRRSFLLDELIANSIPGRAVVIYGARDSIIHRYVGIHPKVELPTITTTSATKVRNSIGIIDSADFRSGVIYGVMNRAAIYYPTVDIAVIEANLGRVLLVSWKEDEGKLRFPGSFFLSEFDNTFEDTGVRCITKEIPPITIDYPRLIGSKKISDQRYRETRDGIVTTMMLANYFGGEIKAGEGVDSVQWVEYADVPNVLAEAHRPLGEMMREHGYR